MELTPALADRAKVIDELDRRLAGPLWPDLETWGDPATIPPSRGNIIAMPPPTRRKSAT